MVNLVLAMCKVIFSRKTITGLYLVGILFLLPSLKVIAQCSGPHVSLFPANVNGVTVTQTYTGAVTYVCGTCTWTDCGITAGPTALGSGALNGAPFTQILTFSTPVNNIIYILSASDSTASNVETFTFTIDVGSLSLIQTTSCSFNQFANVLRANAYGGNGNAAYITLSSTVPYNSITISGNGGNNSSYMALCANSIGIESFPNKDQLMIYPNPSNSMIRLDHTLASDANLEITDVNGNLVYSTVLKLEVQSLMIKVDELQEGVYFCRVIERNKPLKCQKLIILK